MYIIVYYYKIALKQNSEVISHGRVVCPLWSIYLLNLSKLLYLLNVATTFLISKENNFGKDTGQQTGDDTYS